MKGRIPLCSSGSPPVMHTPSRILFLVLRKAKMSSSEISESFSLRKTRLRLWQNGQRKLQPPVNTVQAMCSG